VISVSRWTHADARARHTQPRKRAGRRADERGDPKDRYDQQCCGRRHEYRGWRRCQGHRQKRDRRQWHRERAMEHERHLVSSPFLLRPAWNIDAECGARGSAVDRRHIAIPHTVATRGAVPLFTIAQHPARRSLVGAACSPPAFGHEVRECRPGLCCLGSRRWWMSTGCRFDRPAAWRGSRGRRSMIDTRTRPHPTSRAASSPALSASRRMPPIRPRYVQGSE
jgi:hypothetical protein